MIGYRCLGRGTRFFVPAVQLAGDGRQFVNQVRRDRHLQGERLLRPVVAHLQPEGFIETPLLLFGKQRQVHVKKRKHVHQCGVVGLRRGLGHVKPGELLGQRSPLRTQGRMLLADAVPVGPLRLRVRLLTGLPTPTCRCAGVGQCPDQSALAVLDGGDALLQGGALPRDPLGRAVGAPGGFQGCTKVGSAVRTEDSGGKEAGDSCEKDLFTDP
ncbi:hypothetical protein [Actinacidiphila sp. bgisy167]|uniref:hypothetical protein n=1 Tax=Actinacidiphila sp. bgisy167 TaxID=3413797 RepID=UPI003D72F307